MKLSNPITWGFDPEKSDLLVLANSKARKVWAAIKARHLVDQYFDDDCLAFALAIDRTQTSSTPELIKLATRHRLHFYGNDTATRQPDPERWGELLAWLRGELHVEQIMPAASQPSNLAVGQGALP
jgi:hypothetical protein